MLQQIRIRNCLNGFYFVLVFFVTGLSWSDRPLSPPHPFPDFAQSQVIFEQTIDVRPQLRARLFWRSGSPVRRLEFELRTQQDQFTWNFIPRTEASLAPGSHAALTAGETDYPCAGPEQGGEPETVSKTLWTVVSQRPHGSCSAARPSSGDECKAKGSPGAAGVRVYLPQTPAGGSLAVRAGDRSLKEGNDWALCGEQLIFFDRQVVKSPVEITYSERYRPMLRYPFLLEAQSSALDLQAWRLEPDGRWRTVSVVQEGAELVIDERDFRAGALVRIEYAESPVEPGVLSIPQSLDPRSLTLHTLTQECPRESFLLEEHYLLARCSSDKPWNVVLDYSYSGQRDLIELEASPALTPARWRVLVDGEEFPGYIQGEHSILLLGPFATGMQATLQMIY